MYHSASRRRPCAPLAVTTIDAIAADQAREAPADLPDREIGGKTEQQHGGQEHGSDVCGERPSIELRPTRCIGVSSFSPSGARELSFLRHR